MYDSILPQSISYRPAAKFKNKDDDDPGENAESIIQDPQQSTPAVIPENAAVMPLVTYLRDGADKPAGWHRNFERRARGMFPASSLSQQLEPWERQLVCTVVTCVVQQFYRLFLTQPYSGSC